MQLNMRKLLEDSKLPAINIICQKVATEGLTRFEDRHKLPLGISVNLNSFAAKMLAQVRACQVHDEHAGVRAGLAVMCCCKVCMHHAALDAVSGCRYYLR